MAKRDVKNVFAAIKEHPEQIVHINSVDRTCDRGDTGKFVCPRCSFPMGTKLGDHNRWHFYHVAETSECDANLVNETALHKLAKSILKNSRHIKLPQYVIDAKKDTNRNRYDPNQNEPYIGMIEMNFDYTDAKVEVDLGEIVSDLVLSDGKMQLCVEIAVTHYVDNEKYNKIRNNGISTIEIDICSFLEDDKFDEEKLKEALLEDVKEKKWIFHRKENFFFEEMIKRNKEYQKEYSAFLEKSNPNSILSKKGVYQQHYDNGDTDKKEEHFFKSMSWFQEAIELYGGIPPYCNVSIKSERAFVCPKSIWQMIIFDAFIMTDKKSIFSASDIYVYFQKRHNDILNSDVLFIPNTYADPQSNNLLGQAILEYLNTLAAHSFLEKPSYDSFYGEFTILKRTL